MLHIYMKYKYIENYYMNTNINVIHVFAKQNMTMQ